MELLLHPLNDAVIIWTRITLNEADPVSVNWRMANTDSRMDWTVKLDVPELCPTSIFSC